MLPPLRSDLKLLPASPEGTGQPAWTIHDPVRNRYFRIGPETFECLLRWQTGNADTLIENVSAQTVFQPTPSMVTDLVQFLQTNSLIERNTPDAVDAFSRIANASKPPLLKMAIRNYLFFRLPLWRPDKFLRKTQPLANLIGSRGVRLIVLILGIIGLFLVSRQWDEFVSTLSSYLNWQGAVALALTLMITKILHEFGHALMAKLLGWSVRRTVIGFGRTVFYGRLFNAPLEMRMLPVEGFVQIAPLSAVGARWKHALIYFAGPGIELLLFFTILFFMGSDNFFRIEDDYGRLIVQALAFAALAGAVINLIPMGVITKDSTLPNDGMGIIKSLFSKEVVYQKWVTESRREQDNEREM